MSNSDCCASGAGDDGALHVVIIGTGSGAFAAATKAVEGGARVTLVERADVIGGTCVNVGCVPSKIMIRGAQLASLQRHNPFVGLRDSEPVIDRPALLAQQIARVDELRAAKYESILEVNDDICLISGTASFKDASNVLVTASDGCGFNRSLQHLSSNYRAGGVNNEAKTEKIFHADRDGRGF